MNILDLLINLEKTFSHTTLSYALFNSGFNAQYISKYYVIICAKEH